MTARKLIGIPPSLAARPVVETLASDGRFAVTVDVPARIALRLRDRDLAAGMLGLVDFARYGSEFLIVPGAGISSTAGISAVSLHFGEGLHDVRSFTADPSSSSEIVLARIILSEAFDVQATIVPATGPLPALTGRADAALLHDDDALAATIVHSNAIDLVEEWEELAGLPFVHGLWCAREGDLGEDEWQALRRAHEQCLTHTEAVAMTAARTPPLQAVGLEAIRAFLHGFSYGLDEESIDAIREFLSYAYFHGVLSDIPDLHFFGGESRVLDAGNDPPVN
jgi:predicted solute-binding protein